MDVQLVALAAAVIVVVLLLLTCFLVYGAREREFEEVYGEKTIGLLDEKSKKAADKTVKVKKDKPKHPVPKTGKEEKEKSTRTAAVELDPDEPSTSKQADIDSVPVDIMPAGGGGELRHRRHKRHAADGAHKEEKESGSSDMEPNGSVEKPNAAAKKAHKKGKDKADRKSMEVDAKQVETITMTEHVTHYQSDYKPKGGKEPTPTKQSSAEPEAPAVVKEHKVTQAHAPKQHRPPVVAKLADDNLEAIMSAARSATGITEAQKNALVECVFARAELEQQVSKLQREQSASAAASDRAAAQSKRDMEAASGQLKVQMETERAQAQRMHKQLAEQVNAATKAKETEVGQLKQQLSAIYQENRALRETMERHRQDTSSTGERCGQLEQECATLKEALANTSRELQAKQNALDAAAKQMDTIKSQWAAANSARKEDTDANQSLRGALADKESECRQLREDLSHRCAHPPTDCADVRSSLSAMRAEADKVRGDTAQLWEEYAALKNAVLEKQRCIDAMQQDKGTGGLADEQRAIDQLGIQLESERAQSQRVRDELQQTHNQLAGMQEQLNARDRDEQSVRAQLAAANERCVALQNDQSAQSGAATQVELEQLRATAQRDSDQSKSALARLQGENQTLQNDLSRLNSEFETVCTNLAAGQANIVDVKRQMDAVDKKRHAAETESHALRAQLDSARTELDVCKREAKSAPKAAATAKDGDELGRLKRQIESLQLEVKSEKERRLTAEEDRKSDVETLRGQLVDKDKAIIQLRDEAAMLAEDSCTKPADSSPAVDELRERVATLEGKNAELREKNYKAVENVHQIEATVQHMVHKAEEKYATQLSEERRATAQLLAKLLPAADAQRAAEMVAQPEAEIHREWLHEIERIVKHVHHYAPAAPQQQQPVVQEARDDGEAAQLREHNAELQETLTQLYADLGNIEEAGKLECGKWRLRCNELQAQLEQAQLKAAQTPPVGDAERTHSESHTHTREVIERTNAASALDEQVRQQLTELRERLATEEKDRDALREQVLVLTQTLETERATARDLSSQAVKLRGMLKVGQEALRHEQHSVQQLKEQLRATGALNES